MDLSSIKLTVYFDEPFWAGVFERIEDKKLSVCKVTFGAEPSDGEVWEFLLRTFYKLKFTPAIKSEQKQSPENPKRRQREARKQLQNVGIGTKSQQALALLREEVKLERKKVSQEQKEAEENRKFLLKQQKKKEKHRGH